MSPRPGRLVLLGHPVAHSLSATFQNAALRDRGIPLVYEPLDVAPAELADVLSDLIACRGAGNVTIPHKERVAERCDRLTESAARVGAVNTFWTDEGQLVGDNTDVDGFDALVRATHGAIPAGIRVAVLGAGGGARAVLGAVERWRECAVSIYNRSAERAAELARAFPVIVDTPALIEEAVHGAALIVNATSIGMTDDRMPVPLDALPARATVIDLVYRAGETAWVRAARARGHPTADGRAMLLEQGALAFERWLSIPAPREVMREALAAAL